MCVYVGGLSDSQLKLLNGRNLHTENRTIHDTGDNLPGDVRVSDYLNSPGCLKEIGSLERTLTRPGLRMETGPFLPDTADPA